ncbi:MAG: cytochrome c biogenesis protein [Bacteroidetes bacterium]|nr:cytochrome c biogenesis protein [Bacteroidota bacterium]MCL5737346.1 cytochrome c biogenesis protein [Bacteroidota bacterium]
MKNWMKIGVGIWIAAVVVFGFAMPIGNIPGLGPKARIIFFHVPMSWLAVLAFFMSMWYGISYLRKKEIKYDIKSATAAELGFIFSILATITGSIWAKFNWGSFWNWDPRETSIFVLLLIYGAYFSLRSALENEERRASLSAVYAIVAFVTVPFFVFIMPRIMFSLHPGGEGSSAPIVNANGKMYMDMNMRYVFYASLIGFSVLYVWLFQLRTKISLIAYNNQMENE